MRKFCYAGVCVVLVFQYVLSFKKCGDATSWLPSAANKSLPTTPFGIVVELLQSQTLKNLAHQR
jgi:hypothetical protein